MKFVNLFKKCPWAYYLIQAVLFAAAIVFAALMPRVYIIWDVGQVVGYMVGLLVAFGGMGFLEADVRQRKTAGIVVQTVVFAIVGAGLFPLCQLVLALGLKVGLTSALTIAEVLLLLLAGTVNILLFLQTATQVFGLKPALKNALTPVLIAVVLAVMAVPFATPFANRYLRRYSFLCEPSVFLCKDGYAVMFATSAPGTGGVSVTKNGVTTTYYQQSQGVQVYNSAIHRVEIPKAALNGATYRVFSRQTLNSEDHCLRAGDEIQSKGYRFRAYEGNGDVSFLVVSDNQGTPKPTWKAVQNAAQTKQYDFVLMLGDHAETYNDQEADIIDSFLKVSGLASRGELPVVATLGNHEYRGMLAPDVWQLIPTASPSGEFYYTFTMGDAFFTVLEFGTDHDDDYQEKYGGLVDFNGYKDAEYQWLQSVVAAGEYQAYRYNLVLSHIPLIFQNDVTAYQQVCGECGKTHHYKYREFCDAAQQMGVQYVVSGHTHAVPVEVRAAGYDYTNLQAGSYYAKRAHYRNSIVHLSDGRITYEVYSSEQ